LSVTQPLDGVRVVEVALGVTSVGAGLASSFPGALLRDLGAHVARVEGSAVPSLDSGVEWSRVWNRGKEIIRVDCDRAAAVVSDLALRADVVMSTGPEAAIEARGLGAPQLASAHPTLVGVRIRPSFNALGSLPDLELLVAARAGVCTQIRAHQPGRPAFPDLAVAQAGAAVSATVGALAGLYQRERTGRGMWAETSLYDGIAAMLPMILGRAEHHSATTRLLWQQQGPGESLCYQCLDGAYIQLWFGAKGAYEAFLEHMGEPPSEEGYNAELVSGAMVERGRRWAERFATRDRSWWVEDLAGHSFRCEPVLRPGEALLDSHVREVGLTVEGDDADRGRITALGPVVSVIATRGDTPTAPADPDGGSLLCGTRVLDLSAFLAGPIAPLVLAELGADVVKVEPVSGDVHRNMEPMFAAGQRGKRAVSLDMKAPGASEVLDRLFRWADVVHHNSRVGLAERLGYDERTVRAANPDVVYSFASGFGENGPRSLLATNDQLVQALSGVEHGQAGVDRPPAFLVWGAVDVMGGWIAACGILAGLYARRSRGAGQSVRSSLLGAGLALKSGAFVAHPDDSVPVVVGGPVLDADQLGYGATYRLYQGGDGAWFALAIPDADAWDRLRSAVPSDDLPVIPPPLRVADGGLQPEEELLERVFAAKDASVWVVELRAAGVPVEPVAAVDREGFVAGFVDDPVNQQLHRIVTHHWGARGRVEQPSFPPRFGPGPAVRADPRVPALGEHTAEVLELLGFDVTAQDRLAATVAIAVEGLT
jgi:crotonobetainyl-CoA:carnitine CoA-transferase CaiB-like acyl-CoA transferase